MKKNVLNIFVCGLLVASAVSVPAWAGRGRAFCIARIHEYVTGLHFEDFEGELEKIPASIRAIDTDGNTPLHLAAAWGLEKFVAKLLDNSADIMACNNAGQIPLHMAAGAPVASEYIAPPTGSRVAVIQLLLDADESKRSLRAEDVNKNKPINFARDDSEEERLLKGEPLSWDEVC